MPKKITTLADFKSQFDPEVVVPAKIQAGIDSLLKDGPEAWEYEVEFMKRAGVNNTQMATFRTQFDKHVVTVRAPNGNQKRVWFGSTKVAEKARGG